ncbi:MAG: phosphatase PAP2 family protein [Gemmatimonadota bacterium]
MAFFGLWILLGTVMAVGFSSAGPCYYGRVVAGPDPFAPLMAYLQRVDAAHPLTALDVQALLWEGYVGRGRLIEGIAAMPSLHVAVPVLFTIVAWGVDRRLGVLFGVYTALILVGSVHLAWHYAVDGYVTLALVPAVWWLAGRLARGPSTGS